MVLAESDKPTLKSDEGRRSFQHCLEATLELFLVLLSRSRAVIPLSLTAALVEFRGGKDGIPLHGISCRLWAGRRGRIDSARHQSQLRTMEPNEETMAMMDGKVVYSQYMNSFLSHIKT